MAATEGRVARPERQWGCRRGTPLVTNRTVHILSNIRTGLGYTIFLQYLPLYVAHGASVVLRE